MSPYQQALAKFRRLLAAATEAGDPEPTAMTLATCDAVGHLHARIVLLKHVDEDGFRFFTNYTSVKSDDIVRHPGVALCFHWKTLPGGVQVRVEGTAERLDAVASDAYFATRPRMSQIGAWASLQSQTLPDRAEFETRLADFERRFGGQPVPRPPHWGGYRVVPKAIEFWYGADFRLHERQRYERTGADWTLRRLYP